VSANGFRKLTGLVLVAVSCLCAPLFAQNGGAFGWGEDTEVLDAPVVAQLVDTAPWAS